MKKIISIIIAAIMVLGIAAFAEGGSALDAFNALTGQQVELSETGKTGAEYLTDIMAGAYAAVPADTESAALFAAELQALTAITNRDIASFASANGYHVTQVRNAYYIALANCLRAEIMVNPASEERYRNVQTILALFLETDETKIDHASREAIRTEMNPEKAIAIATEYNLPAAFVEFVIMDDEWEDDKWDNDDDWRKEMGWDDDMDDKLQIGDRDTDGSTRIAELQERLIALGYLTGKADGVFGSGTQAALIQFQLANGMIPNGIFDYDDIDDLYGDDVVARWDYEDSFDYDDTDDAQDSPDYDDTPDAQDSPDYEDTPDVQDSPDYDDSPDVQDSPDYDDTPNAQDSPDYDDTPDVQDSPDYNDSPDVQDSPDYDDTPDVQDSPDYDDSPDVQDSPDYDDTPDAQDSPDYEDTPETTDSPDYEDSPKEADSPDYKDSPEAVDSPDYDDSVDYEDSED